MATANPYRPFTPSRARRATRGVRIDHSIRILTIALALVLTGYLLFDRAFAWVHVPGTPIFVGELALLFGLYVILQTPHLGRLIRLSRPIQLLLLFMLWGFFSAFLGVSEWGLVDTLRDSALWYYGAFALISSVLFLYKPELWDGLVDRLTRYMPAFLGIIVVRFLMSGIDVGIVVPDSTTDITAHKTANIAVNVAISLVFLILVVGPSASNRVRKRATTYTLIGLLVIVAAGTQNRGGFVAAFIILTAVFFMSRQARPAMIGVLAVGVLVAILAAALDVRVSLARRELSVEQILENVQSVTEETTSGSRFDNTTQWRLSFWTIVLEELSEGGRYVAGFGFGDNIALRFGFENPDESVPLRNPHNSHLSVLARMGFVGLALWLGLFWTWYRGLMRARGQFTELGEDRKAALAMWLMLSMTAILVNAFFDPTVEGPQVGVFMWTLFGMGAVLGLGARSIGGRKRRRRTVSPRNFDWMLVENRHPVRDAHPGVELSDDLRAVLAGFDDLLTEEEPEAEEPEG